MMRLSEFVEGVKVKAVGDYAFCIFKDKDYDVHVDDDGCPYILCSEGEHHLDGHVWDLDDIEDPDIPEFVIV